MKLLPLALGLLAAWGAGCSGPREMVCGADAPLPQEDSAAFLDRVAQGRTLTENDAARGVLMLLDGADQRREFGQRVDALRQRGLIGKDWVMVADRPVTRGRLAYMVCQACAIRGGVTMMLLGPSERYCLRELVYRQMMAAGPPDVSATGLEFVSVMARADALIQSGKVPPVLAVREELP
jgi:hypothetical protein